jgi:hypothetical protein
MKDFLPYRNLTLSEVLLIPEAFYQLNYAWIKVQFFPSKKYIDKIDPNDSSHKTVREKSTAKLISSVINGLAKRTPWTSTCLIKAIAAKRMLKKRGINHHLHFGVLKTGEKFLEAHAWLSVDGEVIVGGENHESFVEFKSRR